MENKKTSEAQRKAIKKYDKKTYLRLSLLIRKDDKEVIKKLESVPSKNGYIVIAEGNFSYPLQSTSFLSIKKASLLDAWCCELKNIHYVRMLNLNICWHSYLFQW